MKRLKKVCIVTAAGVVYLYLILVLHALLPRKMTPVSELAGKGDKFVMVNGQSVHYIKVGEGKSLILVHGFAGSTYTWRRLIPLLQDRYAVYALDLSGFGLSDKPPEGCYDMDSQGKLLLGFMDALQLPSATLIGHSMGGVVVACAANAAPSRVESLVLIEPGFYPHGGPSFMKYLFFPLDRLMARQFYSRSFRKKFLVGSFYNKSLVTDAVVDAYMVPTRTPNAVESLAHMMTDVGQRPYGDVAEKISRPTMLLWGERGVGVKSQDAERLKALIPGSRLEYIQKCGHYIQEEKPEEVASALCDFMR